MGRESDYDNDVLDPAEEYFRKKKKGNDQDRMSLTLSDIKNDPERVLFEVNSSDTLRHFLALVYWQIGQIPPTFPPTLFVVY